jgi:hypothetical protein
VNIILKIKPIGLILWSEGLFAGIGIYSTLTKTVWKEAGQLPGRTRMMRR